MQVAFEQIPDVQAILYPPAGGTRTIQGPKHIRMTSARAMTLHALGSYLQQRRAAEPWEDPGGVSPLEIQKLMYFANTVEPGLQLDFTPGRYGPYSDKVRHLLQDMEGAFTVGFGDGTAKVLDNEPISVTDSGNEALAAFLETDSSATAITTTVDTVLDAIEGFEGPYGVELLASTHWVATHEGARDPESAGEAVRSWTKRKGRIYTDDRVRIAFERVLEKPLGKSS